MNDLIGDVKIFLGCTVLEVLKSTERSLYELIKKEAIGASAHPRPLLTARNPHRTSWD